MKHASVVALSAAVCASMWLGPGSAQALPVAGATRPAVRLVDAWDKTLDVGSIGAKPVLVLYEGKESSAQNKQFKEELLALGRSKRYQSIAVLVIADLQSYDYWPVRGFAKDAVKEKSAKYHRPIYCDWSGTVRSAFDLQRGASNIVLYGKDGHALFAYAGNLSDDTRRTALETLAQQADAASDAP
jgi:hypothetical protein